MRRSTAFSGFVVVVLFGLSGCGSSESSSGGADGAQPGGGETGGSASEGTGGAGGSTASCPGPNPATANCVFYSANVCIPPRCTTCVPSHCSCATRSEVLGWECTADCRTDLPMCPDVGTTPDAGTAPDAKPAPDSGKSGIPCGNTFCSSAQYCCNANCGTCAPLGADCAYQECAPPASWACASDSDCTTVDDYCGGCNCSVLGPKGGLGTCTKGLVNCFVAPCATKSARCENGQCALVTR
jgi:hypothetical protein